jgi:uroporphyrinogen-III synthase
MPTSDKFVTLTRDERGNRAWRASLEEKGIPVYELPCIETNLTPLTPAIQDTLSRFTDFHWVILTSAAGVRHFAQLVVNAGLGRRHLTSVWYAAVGAQTADAIKSLGLVVRFTPSEANASTLARELKQVKSRQILLLHTNIAPPEAADILRRRSANVTVLPIYQTVPVTAPDPGFNQLLRDGSIGHLVFASPSAVDGIQRRLADPVALELARDIPAIAFGPGIAAALGDAGFRDIRTTSGPSLSAVIEQLT